MYSPGCSTRWCMSSSTTRPMSSGCSSATRTTAAAASPISSPEASSRTQAATTSRARSATSSAGVASTAPSMACAGSSDTAAFSTRSVRRSTPSRLDEVGHLGVRAHADEHLERRDREQQLGLGPVVDVDRVAGGGPHASWPARRSGAPGSRSPAPGGQHLEQERQPGPEPRHALLPELTDRVGGDHGGEVRAAPSRSVVAGPSSWAPIHSSDSGSGLGMSRPWRLAMDTFDPQASVKMTGVRRSTGPLTGVGRGTRC